MFRISSVELCTLLAAPDTSAPLGQLVRDSAERCTGWIWLFSGGNKCFANDSVAMVLLEALFDTCFAKRSVVALVLLTLWLSNGTNLSGPRAKLHCLGS